MKFETKISKDMKIINDAITTELSAAFADRGVDILTVTENECGTRQDDSDPDTLIYLYHSKPILAATTRKDPISGKLSIHIFKPNLKESPLEAN